MEKKHKETIRCNFRALRDQFATAIDVACMDLITSKTINKYMKDQVLANSTDTENAEELLDLITRRGPDAYNALYEVAKKRNLYEAADILKPDNRPHEPKEEVEEEDGSEQEILNDSWQSHSLLANGIRPVVQKCEQCPHKVKDGVYRMKHGLKEKCYIISYDNCCHKVDRMGIAQIFNKLGFTVKMKPKVKCKEDVGTHLKSIKEDESINCLIVFHIAGPNDLYSNSAEAKRYICDTLQETENLVGVPKLVFYITPADTDKASGESVNGARDTDKTSGESQNRARDIDEARSESQNGTTDITKAFESMHLRRSNSDSLEKHANKEVKLGGSSVKPGDKVDGPGGEICSPEMEIRPSDSDIFWIEFTDCGNSTVTLNGRNGTYGIQLILYIFSKLGHKMDLHDLLRIVNRKAEMEKNKIVTASTLTSMEKLFLPFTFTEDCGHLKH